MNLTHRTVMFTHFDIRLKLLICLMLIIITSGCIPTVERTFKTPKAQGRLLHFTPENITKFTPVADAKVYYRAYPEVVAYSNKQGEFVLPAVIKIEAKLLMVGHAMVNSSIVIEQGALKQITFARSTLNSRYLEEGNLGSIILTGLDNASRQGADLGGQPSLPCDEQIIESLEQALITADRLVNFYQKETISAHSIKAYMTEHYLRSIMLLPEAKNSCQWQDESKYLHWDKIEQTRGYFSEAEQLLDRLVSAQKS